MLKLLLGLLLCTLSLAAQTTLYVSPNTREHLDRPCAAESRDSFEQRNFMAVSRRLAERLCHSATVTGAEGLYGIGDASGENSGVISGCGPAAGHYVGALLATFYHQKWFLLFTPDPNGKAELFTLSLPNVGRQQILVAFDAAHVDAATMIETGSGYKLYVIPDSPEQRTAVQDLARQLKAQVTSTRGTSELIGNDSRAKAAQKFAAIIARQEKQSGKHLAATVFTSPEWRDAGLD